MIPTNPPQSQNGNKKALEIQYIIQKFAMGNQSVPHIQPSSQAGKHRVHLLRALFIAIDMTESMHIRDIKPSRLAYTIEMVRKLIKTMRDKTPICKFIIAKVENQLCKPVGNWGYGDDAISQLDFIKVSHNAGFFSLQNILCVAMDYFQAIPNTFHKQLLIIQSSPFTKDYRDIYQTISTFQASKISTSIGSLVGSTFVFQKLAQSCHGKYVTLSNQKQFQDFIMGVTENPVFQQDTVMKKLVRMSLSRRQYANEKSGKVCFCHYRPVTEYFVCGNCGAVLCEKMPIQCGICMALLVFPSDLHRYKN